MGNEPLTRYLLAAPFALASLSAYADFTGKATGTGGSNTSMK